MEPRAASDMDGEAGEAAGELLGRSESKEETGIRGARCEMRDPRCEMMARNSQKLTAKRCRRNLEGKVEIRK